jgi:hypothetical protein
VKYKGYGRFNQATEYRIMAALEATADALEVALAEAKAIKNLSDAAFDDWKITKTIYKAAETVYKTAEKAALQLILMIKRALNKKIGFV